MNHNEEIGKAFKVIAERIRNMKPDNFYDKPCKTYGCLYCKNYRREEGYDQQWGRFAFFYYKCKKQPDRNMYNKDNAYSIFDIEPDYSPHFHYDKAKGECPYFERGENELVYMTKEEKERCIY